MLSYMGLSGGDGGNWTCFYDYY